MARKWDSIVRVVKNWDGLNYGWWAWSSTEQNWVVIKEDNIPWLLDFLPANNRPTIGQLKEEAFSQVTSDPITGVLMFHD